MHSHTRAYVSFLSISPYFFLSPSSLLLSSRPQTRNRARISQLQSVGSSTSKRPKEGACGTAFATTYHPCNRVASLSPFSFCSLFLKKSKKVKRSDNRLVCVRMCACPSCKCPVPPGKLLLCMCCGGRYILNAAAE